MFIIDLCQQLSACYFGISFGITKQICIMSMMMNDKSAEAEKKMAEKVEEQRKWIKKMTKKFNLHEEPISVGTCRTGPLSLEAEMLCLAETAASASFVGLPTLEQTAKKALELANALYKRETGNSFVLLPVETGNYLTCAKQLCIQMKSSNLQLEDLEVKGHGVEGGNGGVRDVGGAAGASVEGGGCDEGRNVGGMMKGMRLYRVVMMRMMKVWTLLV